MTAVILTKARPKNTKPVKVRVLKSFLRREGFYEVSKNRSAHRKFKHSDGRCTGFTDHGHTELSACELKKVLNQADYSLSDFYNTL